jgi:hypothetical protein
MGAKLNFNTATFRVEVTLAPDVNDLIHLDWDVDGWSDGILDWEASVVKRGHTFPIQAIGGQTTSGGKLGSTFLLLAPWQIEPYEADHELLIEGNLFHENATTRLVLPTIGAFTVTVNMQTSTLVEVVEALAAAEVNVKLDKIVDGVYGQKLIMHSTDPTATPAPPPPGYIIMWEADGLTLIGHKEIWEDRTQTIGYRGRGIGWESMLLPGLPAGYP